MGDPFRRIDVRNFFEHLEMLVPRMGERSEGFRRDARFAVQAGCRRRRFDRLEVQRAYVPFGKRLPELAHRDVRIFVIFEDVRRENIAGGGFVRDRQALFPGPSRHVAEEVFGEEVADDPPPVVQKARGLFRGVDHVTEQGRDPFSQAVARAFDEFFFHFRRPCLGFAFPTVEQHAVEQSAGQGAAGFGEPADISVELRVGTGRR